MLMKDICFVSGLSFRHAEYPVLPLSNQLQWPEYGWIDLWVSVCVFVFVCYCVCVSVLVNICLIGELIKNGNIFHNFKSSNLHSGAFIVCCFIVPAPLNSWIIQSQTTPTRTELPWKFVNPNNSKTNCISSESFIWKYTHQARFRQKSWKAAKVEMHTQFFATPLATDLLM